MADRQLDIDGIKIRVVGNVDKIEGFIYYTCYMEDGNFIVFSKFDGDTLLLNSSDKGVDQKLIQKLIDILSND